MSTHNICFCGEIRKKYQNIILNEKSILSRAMIDAIFIYSCQDLYRYAYSFLGTLLFLQHEFPPPSEIFCGSVWTAFFMASHDESK